MTREERVKKLRYLITCMKCEVSGKVCDNNCSTQYDAGNMGDIIENLEEIAKALKQEPCEDVISRKSIKQKLQEHHDFFVNAYGGFSNLPQNDKSRVDEITNCIAMVVNEPSVTPQEPRKGHWKLVQRGKNIDICCSNCKAVRIKECAYNYTIDQLPKEDIKECFEFADMSYCPYCGSDNREVEK